MMDKMKLFINNKNNLILLVLAGVLLMVITFPVKDKDTNGGSVENQCQESSEPTLKLIDNPCEQQTEHITHRSCDYCQNQCVL